MYNTGVSVFFDTDTDEYYQTLKEKLASIKNDKQLFKAIVNSPFEGKHNVMPLGLGIVVLLLVNKQEDMLERIALSETEPAKGAVNFSVKPFEEIKIPLNHPENILIKAIQTNKPQKTDDWQYLFTPELTPEEARFNQAGAGIGSSVVYPLNARERGALIFSYYLPLSDITARHHRFMKKYAKFISVVL